MQFVKRLRKQRQSPSAVDQSFFSLCETKNLAQDREEKKRNNKLVLSHKIGINYELYYLPYLLHLLPSISCAYLCAYTYIYIVF